VQSRRCGAEPCRGSAAINRTLAAQWRTSQRTRARTGPCRRLRCRRRGAAADSPVCRTIGRTGTAERYGWYGWQHWLNSAWHALVTQCVRAHARGRAGSGGSSLTGISTNYSCTGSDPTQCGVWQRWHCRATRGLAAVGACKCCRWIDSRSETFEKSRKYLFRNPSARCVVRVHNVCVVRVHNVVRRMSSGACWRIFAAPVHVQPPSHPM
jgi:hypothetical protein